MRKILIAVAALSVLTVEAQADDEAVITITTTVTETNSKMIFAQMERSGENWDNLGTDFVRRYGLGGPPTDTSSNAAAAARELSRGNNKGVINSLATLLGLKASQVVMERTVEQIESEQAAARSRR